MKFTSIEDQIVQSAKDYWCNLCHPVLTNDIHPERAFRVPDDGKPMGFNFLPDTKPGKKDGVSIEVHQTGIRNILMRDVSPQTYRHVPVLLILGIQHSNLEATIIKQGVLAHE